MIISEPRNLDNHPTPSHEDLFTVKVIKSSMNSRELVNRRFIKVFMKRFFMTRPKVPTNWVQRLVIQGLVALIKVSFAKRAKMPTPQVQRPNKVVKLAILFQLNLVTLEVCLPLKPNYPPSRIWFGKNILIQFCKVDDSWEMIHEHKNKIHDLMGPKCT